MSDHEHIMMKLNLQVQCSGCTEKIYSPRPSQAKASDVDIHNYLQVLSHRLRGIKVPIDILLCKELQCSNFSLS
jgi:hypothetical protein